MNNKRFVSKLLLVLISMGACAPHQEDAIAISDLTTQLRYLRGLREMEERPSTADIVESSLEVLRTTNLSGGYSDCQLLHILEDTQKEVECHSMSLERELLVMLQSLHRANTALKEKERLPPEEVTTLEREIKTLSARIRKVRKTVKSNDRLLMPVRTQWVELRATVIGLDALRDEQMKATEEQLQEQTI